MRPKVIFLVTICFMSSVINVAIVGAGAMGSLLGHGFTKGGYSVTLVDQHERVSRIRSAGGLRVVAPDGSESFSVPDRITDDYSEAGVNDIVILACKAQNLSVVAPSLRYLAHDGTVFITIQNGIPWWYLHGTDGIKDYRRIDCLDPDGALEKAIDPSVIIGCVAYPAAIMEADGRVRHVEGFRCPIGELDGSEQERTRRVAQLFEDGGFKSRIIEDIRSEIWLKAWGALSINPISALTRATMEDICTFPQTRDLVARMMGEAQAVAEALGVKFRHTIEKRIEGARAVGQHKTSMLQDVEAGRELELDALMLAVQQLADRTGVETPAIRDVYACASLLNKGLSKGGEPGS